MTADEFASIGLRAMSAPNRYRKMFKDYGCDGFSPALQWFFAAADDGNARQKALDMMTADWPDQAHLAVGMEPTIDLSDVVLIWRLSEVTA
jgi:hypothetical protein